MKKKTRLLFEVLHFAHKLALLLISGKGGNIIDFEKIVLLGFVGVNVKRLKVRI